MTWKSLDQAAETGPEAVFWWSMPRLAFLGCVFGLVGIVVAVAGFVVNPAYQAARVVNKTIDADNVIANYEWFKQRHQDILAIDQKIKEAAKSVSDFKGEAGDREKWHREDREEFSRLNAVANGLSQQRSDMAAEYEEFDWDYVDAMLRVDPANPSSGPVPEEELIRYKK